MANPSFTPHGILLLSSGSKVAIARIAKQAALKRGLALHATDTTENIPTRCFADAFSTLPPSDQPDWSEQLVDYCQRNAIALLIPTRHADLRPLSKIQATLEAGGTHVSLSHGDTLDICLQKSNTAKFLSKIGSPAPETFLRNERSTSELADLLPLFAKPNRGSASQGARMIRSEEELSSVPGDWILQTPASGVEYTVNLFLERSGKALCAVPHRRIVVESGEVAQARTERVTSLMQECSRIGSELPGAQGILNIQAILEPETGAFQIIEINPRIGGGYPLCDAAKATYIEWLCQETLDQKAVEPFDRWTDNLLMMRYRDAVFSVQS